MEVCCIGNEPPPGMIAMRTISALFALLMACSGIAVSAEQQAFHAAGKKLYRTHCIHCHGNGFHIFAPHEQATFRQLVRQGSGLMPAFGERLDDPELDRLWNYLRAQRTQTAAD